MAAAAHDYEVITNATTPFTESGDLDEQAYRDHLQRMVDAGVGIFVGSPGSGAVHSLNRDEFRRTCEIAVEVGGGRVPVYSMTPESHNLKVLIEWAQTASETGVDEVQLWQLMGGHHMIPTQADQLAFWRAQLSVLDRPVALSLHAVAGYFATPDLIHQLCSEFPQIRTIYTYGSSSSYMLDLGDATPDHVRIGGHILRAPLEFALGATITTGAEPNIVPVTSRAIIDSWAAGDVEKLQEAFQKIERIGEALAPWRNPNTRSLKMAQRVLGLPGGEGSFRAPVTQPDEAEYTKVAEALDRLGVREWDDFASS
jgi:4-hydroxy-tetrahydrodipicolinate synthase